MKPKYPIYVISKGRYDTCHTAKFLIKDKVDFKLVVEPQEEEQYRKNFGKHVTVLPFSNLGQGSIPARNWCWEDAKKNGHFRHWILDDNIRCIKRNYKGKRINTKSQPAFISVEEFTDRYENIAIAGLNYTMFVVGNNPPFYHNVHVYSFLLIRNDLPHRWRGRYNEDTDLCLQVLSDKWCTVLINVFCCEKLRTMTMKGGNSDELYKGDGRLKMANSLKRVWPHVVSVNRRFQRPQHIIAYNWRKFDTPLIKKQNIVINEKFNEFGLKLKANNEIKSQRLQKLYKEYNKRT